MPRVSYPENEKFWNGTNTPEDDPLNLNMDFCRTCFDNGDYEDHIPDNVPQDAVDVDTDHPPYGDPCFPYTCEHCNTKLTEKDA